MDRQIAELANEINASINSKEKTKEILDKISVDQKAELFDELLKRANTPSIENGLKLCDILIDLSESIHDNLRIYHAYSQRGMFRLFKGHGEISKSCLENSRRDLKKAISILPSLGVATDAGIPLKSPASGIFLFLSDSELGLGDNARMSGREGEASEHYQNARDILLRLIPESKDSPVKDDEAFYFEKLGDAYSTLRSHEDLSEAIKNYDKALSSTGLLKPSNKSSELNSSKGDTYQRLGKFSEAENCYMRAIDIALAIGNNEKAANNYLSLTNLYANRLNRFEEALSSARRAIDLSVNQNTKTIALQVSGVASVAMGRYRDAFKIHAEVADLFNQANNPKEEAFARSLVASDLSLMGKHKEAAAELKSSLEIYEKLDDRGQIVQMLCKIALENINLGAYEDALSRTKKALEISGELKNQALEARCLDLQGDIYYMLHSYKDSEQSYFKSMGKFSGAGDLRGRIKESLKWATIKLSLSELDVASSMIQTAIDEIDTSQPESMKDIKAGAYWQLADVYIAQKKNLDDQAKTAKIGSNRDDIKAKSVQSENAAHDCLMNALKIYNSLGMKRNEADVYRALSQLKLEGEKYREAIHYLDKAIEFYKEIDRDDVLISNNIKAQILFLIGDLKESRSLLEESLKSNVSSQLSNPSNLASSYLGLGAIFHRLGQEEQARVQFLKAIDLLDSFRSKLSSGDLRISFQGQEDTLHSAVVRSYFLEENYEKALEFSERAKSRVLLEQIRTTRLRKPQGLDISLIERENDLISELNASIKKGSNVDRTNELDIALQNLLDQMEEKHSSSPEIREYVALRRGVALNCAEISALLKDDKSAILEFYILRDRVLIFLIASESKSEMLRIASREVDKSHLKDLCMLFSSSMDNLIHEIKEGSRPMGGTSSISISKIDNILGELSFYLLDPVAELLKDFDHLYIIPHSFLHYIPFHAMPINGQRMIENFSVSYSPSASVLKYCLSRPSEDLGRYFIFRSPDSDLAFAEPETVGVSEILGNAPITGSQANKTIDATKQAVISNLPGKDIIHFSCHASFNAEEALNSSVKLSIGELISARDFFGLDLSAKLVSLSACESARSQEKPGDEMIGLVRSILFAGSCSVLASLWSVDDLATYIMTTEFYRNLISEGMDEHSALRSAQIRLMNLTAGDLQGVFNSLSHKEYTIPREYGKLVSVPASEKIFDHIFYWAPFIAIGSWLK